MGISNDDISLKLAKAVKSGFLPDVSDSEVAILKQEANELFIDDEVFLANYGQVLSLRKYAPVSYVSFSATDTAFVDVSATELYVTFDAPNSGNVEINFNGYVSLSDATTSLALNLRDESGDVTGTVRRVATGAKVRINSTFYLTDLIPGQEYTYKLGFARPSGAGNALLETSSTLGDMVMKVATVPK